MTKFCTRCGTPLTEQSLFCGKCGAAAQGETAQPAPFERSRSAPPDQDRVQTPTVRASYPSPLRTVASGALLVGLILWLAGMDVGFLTDHNYAYWRDHWALLETPQRRVETAVTAGWVGMFWGAVLGGVGGWIKTLKDRRSRRI